MKIDSSTPIVPNQPTKEVEGVQRRQQSVGREQAGVTGGDVSLTPLATQLMKMEQSLSKTEVVDTGRVKEVSAAIQSGTYQVDAAMIADRMIQASTGLLSSRAA